MASSRQKGQETNATFASGRSVRHFCFILIVLTAICGLSGQLPRLAIDFDGDVSPVADRIEGFHDGRNVHMS